MELDTSKLIENAIREGMCEGIKQRLSQGYSNPLDKIITEVLNTNSEAFRDLLQQGMDSCMSNVQFREEIKTSVRTTLARTLIQRFGGELEKQVNALKSDPTTRARITVAIEDIVKEKTS